MIRHILWQLIILSVIFLSSSALMCPMFPSAGLGGILPGYGTLPMCPQDTIFYYYTCCEDIFGECCIHLETWFIIFIVITAIFGIILFFGCIAACAYGFRS